MADTITPLIQDYIIDFASNNNFFFVKGVQGDGYGVRYARLSLSNNGLSYIIDKNSVRAVVRGTKPDTKQIFNECEIVGDSVIQFELTNQMLAVAGKGEYEISIMSTTENRVLTSFPFYVITSPSTSDVSFITSSNEFTLLINKINEAEKVTGEAEAVVEEAKLIFANCEEKTAECIEATNKALSATDEFIRLTEEIEQAEIKRNEDEQERIANEEQREQNETERQSIFESLKEDSEEAVEISKNAANTAQEALDILQTFDDQYLKNDKIANNLTTTDEGYILDARQGNELQRNKMPSLHKDGRGEWVTFADFWRYIDDVLNSTNGTQCMLKVCVPEGVFNNGFSGWCRLWVGRQNVVNGTAQVAGHIILMDGSKPPRFCRVNGGNNDYDSVTQTWDNILLSSNIANNVSTESEGYVLDARQGIWINNEITNAKYYTFRNSNVLDYLAGDMLKINTGSVTGEYNKRTAYFINNNNKSQFYNLPSDIKNGTGTFSGYRKVLWYATNLYTVILTETYPNAGRTYANTFLNGAWQGWVVNGQVPFVYEQDFKPFASDNSGNKCHLNIRKYDNTVMLCIEWIGSTQGTASGTFSEVTIPLSLRPHRTVYITTSNVANTQIVENSSTRYCIGIDGKISFVTNQTGMVERLASVMYFV